MKPRVYVETSVVSYLTAEPSRDIVIAGRQHSTREWWAVAPERFELVTSDLVLQEAGGGDVTAPDRVDALASLVRLDEMAAARRFTERLLRRGAVPERAATHAAHLAVAAVNGIDYLVTWNSAHIANAATRRRIEAECLRAGFDCPVVCRPDALIETPVMNGDPILGEVRTIRDKLAAECGYDVKKIVQRVRQRQAQSGLEYVSCPPRPVVVPDDTAAPPADDDQR
ncbi:MAG: DNA-binding protein [Gammaproteobacteria bacterium]|nr:DNA-binding protein [Gammaproteobacteria bacterium]